MTLEEIRLSKIKVIINTLNQAKKAGTSVDYEKLIHETSFLFGTSRRTSMDYIEMAIRETGFVEVRINGTKELFHRSMSFDKINTPSPRDLSEKEKEALRMA